MVRGTTPAYTVTFDGIDLDEVEKVVVTFEQTKSGVELTLPEEQVHKEDTGFWFRLTQAQTLGFQKGTVKRQVRFKMKSSNAWASSIGSDANADVLYEEVI